MSLSNLIEIVALGFDGFLLAVGTVEIMGFRLGGLAGGEAFALPAFSGFVALILDARDGSHPSDMTLPECAERVAEAFDHNSSPKNSYSLGFISA